jgi:hypothetical protein
MDRSIELYDQLHTCGREQAMSIEEANAEGCNFYDNEATRQAFADFRECFRNFCEEQNCIEGEPFAQESPSIKPFLDQHKATKRPSRRLKIGVKAPPVLSIARQANLAVSIPEAPPAPRSLITKIEESSVLKKAESSLVKKTAVKEPTTAIKQMSIKESNKDASFENFVQSSASAIFKDAVFFLPKQYEEEFLRGKAEYVKRHGFQGKHAVLEKLKRFRELMRTSSWSKANEIEIVSMTGTMHKVANIAFNFTSLDDCLADTSKIPFVKMLSMAPLKR